MLAFCPHTKRLVGYAHDAFDVDAICEEFKRKYKVAADNEEQEADEDDNAYQVNKKIKSSDSNVKLGKHYMVFMAQHVTSKGRAMSFMVARYCLASLTGRWVRVNKRQITSALAYTGFVVIHNSFDGATENRAAMNQDLSLSLKQLLPDLTSKYEDDDLPWDMMIAYPHPTLDNEIISSAADMGHAVKKQANAVELSGKEKHKRDLHLNGLPVQLRMAYDVYKESSDYAKPGINWPRPMSTLLK